MHNAKRIIALLLILSLAAFSGSCAQYHYEGAAVGGALGGLAGALLDDKNPWRGGVIGAAIGAAFGATLAEVSARGARQAAQTGKPVEYRTDDGRGLYRAEPVGYDAETKCHKVQERVWQDGKLVKDEIREVCEGEKTEPGYLGEERRAYDYPPPPSREHEYEYEHMGPPPWAPAHGYRAKYRYRYYPSSYVYYSVDRDLYFYYSSGRWVESTWLPRGIYLDRDDYVVLEMDVEKPHRFHRDVVKWYPPGYKKKSTRPRGYY